MPRKKVTLLELQYYIKVAHLSYSRQLSMGSPERRRWRYGWIKAKALRTWGEWSRE
jgi:hypothetical protein